MGTYNRLAVVVQALDAVEDQAVVVQERESAPVVEVPEGGDHEGRCLRTPAARGPPGLRYLILQLRGQAATLVRGHRTQRIQGAPAIVPPCAHRVTSLGASHTHGVFLGPVAAGTH